MDYGLGVIRNKGLNKVNYTIDSNLFEEINELQYIEMKNNCKDILNLKNEQCIHNFISRLKK